jgi:hypothetical protein
LAVDTARSQVEWQKRFNSTGGAKKRLEELELEQEENGGTDGMFREHQRLNDHQRRIVEKAGGLGALANVERQHYSREGASPAKSPAKSPGRSPGRSPGASVVGTKGGYYHPSDATPLWREQFAKGQRKIREEKAKKLGDNPAVTQKLRLRARAEKDGQQRSAGGGIRGGVGRSESGGMVGGREVGGREAGGRTEGGMSSRTEGSAYNTATDKRVMANTSSRTAAEERVQREAREADADLSKALREAQRVQREIGGRETGSEQARSELERTQRERIDRCRFNKAFHTVEGGARAQSESSAAVDEARRTRYEAEEQARKESERQWRREAQTRHEQARRELRMSRLGTHALAVREESMAVSPGLSVDVAASVDVQQDWGDASYIGVDPSSYADPSSYVDAHADATYVGAGSSAWEDLEAIADAPGHSIPELGFGSVQSTAAGLDWPEGGAGGAGGAGAGAAVVAGAGGGGAGGGAAGGQYECENLCGFLGSYEHVEQHEMQCSASPASRNATAANSSPRKNPSPLPPPHPPPTGSSPRTSSLPPHSLPLFDPSSPTAVRSALLSSPAASAAAYSAYVARTSSPSDEADVSISLAEIDYWESQEWKQIRSAYLPASEGEQAAR